MHGNILVAKSIKPDFVVYGSRTRQHYFYIFEVKLKSYFKSQRHHNSGTIWDIGTSSLFFLTLNTRKIQRSKYCIGKAKKSRWKLIDYRKSLSQSLRFCYIFVQKVEFLSIESKHSVMVRNVRETWKKESVLERFKRRTGMWLK